MEDEERIAMLAERVKLLFGFCADLIKDKDLILEAGRVAAERRSFAMTAAPVLGAMGIDYTEGEADAKLHQKRASALYNLLKTLEDTEREREEEKERRATIEKHRAELRKKLGI